MNQHFADATKLVRLDRSALSEAKTILFHAYRHEPIFQYLFESTRPGYDQRVRATLRECLELHFSQQQDAIGLLDNDALVAVAFICSPEAKSSFTDHFNWRVKMILTAGLNSTKRFVRYNQQVRMCLPDEHYHILPFIGVHPKSQNRGFGRVLMDVVEGICRDHPQSAGIGLDTGNTRYIRFYTNIGFQKVGEVVLGNFAESVMFKPCA